MRKPRTGPNLGGVARGDKHPISQRRLNFEPSRIPPWDPAYLNPISREQAVEESKRACLLAGPLSRDLVT